jgi:hypothetical protein
MRRIIALALLVLMLVAAPGCGLTDTFSEWSASLAKYFQALQATNLAEQAAAADIDAALAKVDADQLKKRAEAARAKALKGGE